MFTLDGMIDWSFGFALIVGVTFWWAKSQKYQWLRGSDIAIILLMIFGGAMGTQYFVLYKTLPPLFGIEDTLMQREDLNPVFFLGMLTFVGFYATRWLLAGWNIIATKVSKGKLPVLSTMVIGLALIGLCMWSSGLTTAYYYKATGKDPGGYSYGVVTTVASSTFGFFADMLEDGQLVPTKKK